MPRNSPNCSNKHRHCCAAGLVTARCSPIGLKTGRSNTARWISAAVHNSRPGVCLRKASHRNCGSNWVEAKKTIDGQQALPNVVYWPAAEATRPIFTAKRLHTGRSNHRWATTAFQGSQKREQQRPILLSLPQTRKGYQKLFWLMRFLCFSLSILSTTRWPRWRHST